jgi:MFS family permease
LLGLFAAAASLLVIWLRVEGRAAEPLIDLTMLRLRAVWTTNAAGLLIGVAMFGAMVLVPQLALMPESTGYGFGTSVTGAGLMLLPAPLGMLLTSPVAGRISHRLGPKVPLVVGALLTAVSFVALAGLHAQTWQVCAATALMGVGMGFAYAAMPTLIIEAVPASQTGVATGTNTVVRTIGGAVGSQLVAAIVASSVLASGLPAERGFTLGFAVSAAALAGAVLVALAVPGRRRPEPALAPAVAMD